MNWEAQRALVRCLLENAMHLPHDAWTVQGFGFLRLRVSPDVRLHVWDTRLRVPGASDIHDHAQWAFESTVLSGMLTNIKFGVEHSGPVKNYNEFTLQCGIGGGLKSDGKPVFLFPGTVTAYVPGAAYRQEPEEVHRTHAADGTVTLITQERRDTLDARVFVPIGGCWGDAIPRQATRDESQKSPATRCQSTGAEMAMTKLKYGTPKTPGAAVDLLFKIREGRKLLQAKADAEKEQEDLLRNVILEKFAKGDLEGARGKLAQASIRRSDLPQIEDFDKAWDYAVKHKANDLFQRRLSTEACRARWERGEAIPGVGVFTKVDISLTKAKGSKSKTSKGRSG